GRGAQRGAEAPPVQTEEELGELLLGVVRDAAAHGLDPEQALRKAVRRFQHGVMQEKGSTDLD
ncbi:hypothetical protein ACFQ36_22435, partial [Arthrobacter sp. GCM10027362]